MIKVAFYDTKEYDRASFEKLGNEEISYKFLDTKLNIDTADLAAGCDAVCVFVNDAVDGAVIDRLYALGIKMIALRCFTSTLL